MSRIAHETDWSGSTSFVMSSTVEQVARWVADDVKRARLVIAVESARPKPRRELLARMESVNAA